MSTLQSPLIARDTCLSEDVVLAFQNGETTEAERQHIHRHVDSCQDCRKLLLATAGMQEGSTLGVELDSVERLAAVMGSGLRMTAFAEGKQLAQRFNVRRFVDRGGMGEVYEAFDSVVGARVALKALLSTALDDAPGARRLGDEVELARRVAHPNVCRIYDLHEHREPEHRSLWFLAMEFVDGVTLKERLLAGPLCIDEACAVARQLLLGLGAVHAAGVLHLDFKSQNVMLRRGANPAHPVVMDFSLSRAFEKELRLRTSERRAAGSIGYMSPEQLECQSTIGPAADVYAFGVVFYEMLTGQMPFQGSSPAAIMLKQLKSRLDPPSQARAGISPALDEFVLTCLSRHARSRFQNVESALAALDQCSQPAQRQQGPYARLRSLAGAALALAGAGALALGTWRMTAHDVPVPSPALTLVEGFAGPRPASQLPAPGAAAPATGAAAAPSSAGDSARAVGATHVGELAPGSGSGSLSDVAAARSPSHDAAPRRPSASEAPSTLRRGSGGASQLGQRSVPAQARLPASTPSMPAPAQSESAVPNAPAAPHAPPAGEKGGKPARPAWVPEKAPDFLL